MGNFDFSLAEYLCELEHLVNIDSGSKDIAGTTAIADYFAEKFEQIGWQVKYYRPNPAVGPCLEITNRAGDPVDILLIGHMIRCLPQEQRRSGPLRSRTTRPTDLV